MKKSGPLAPGEGLVLIGPRGAGKSAAAVLLASQLGWARYSTDDMIRGITGVRNDVFLRDHGWDEFRVLEEKCVRAACLGGRRVVDTGGGAGLRPANRPWLRRHRVVFLDVDVDSALRRLGSDRDPHRPPLTKNLGQRDDWLKMIRERRELYGELADLRLDSAQAAPEALVRRVLALTLACRRS